MQGQNHCRCKAPGEGFPSEGVEEEFPLEARQRMAAQRVGVALTGQVSLCRLAQKAAFAQRTGQFLHAEDEVHRRAGKAFLAQRTAAAEQYLAVMQDESEVGCALLLKLAERGNERGERFGAGGGGLPEREEAVAQILVHRAAGRFDELLAAAEPLAHEHRQFVRRAGLRGARGAFHVGDEEPAGGAVNIHQSLHRGARGGGRAKGGTGVAEGKVKRAEAEPVVVAQAHRLADAAVVDVGAVAATEVHQPELALALRMDGRVAAGDALIGKHDFAARDAAEGKVAGHRHAAAVGFFEPGWQRRFAIHDGGRVIGSEQWARVFATGRLAWAQFNFLQTPGRRGPKTEARSPAIRILRSAAVSSRPTAARGQAESLGMGSLLRLVGTTQPRSGSM